MANLTIIKPLGYLELVQDSAMIQVRATDYMLSPEVLARYDYEVDSAIPLLSGMKFEINGIWVAWWSMHNILDEAYSNNDYYALVEDTHSGTTYTNEQIAKRMVMAMKAHPNYEEFSELADIVYDGGASWHIVCRNAGDVLEKYTSFALNSMSGGPLTYTHPSGLIVFEDATGTLDSSANPHTLTGSELVLREDFKLIVDIRIGENEIISENYYPDKKGYAEIDVAGIVNRYFENSEQTFSLTDALARLNPDTMQKFKVWVRSYYDNAVQETITQNAIALNGYTGNKNRKSHTTDVKKLWYVNPITGKIKPLTMMPDNTIIPATYGASVHYVLWRELTRTGTTTQYDGWGNDTKIRLLVVYKNGSFEYIDRAIPGLEQVQETLVLKVSVNKASVQSIISGVWEDINFISVFLYETGNKLSEPKQIMLNHKTTGDERVFMFRNRYGVPEMLPARVSIGKGTETKKEIAAPMQKWNNEANAGNEVVYAASKQDYGSAEVGFFGAEYSELLKDFLASKEHYIYEEGNWVSVRVDADKYDLDNTAANLSPMAFNFTYNFIKRT